LCGAETVPDTKLMYDIAYVPSRPILLSLAHSCEKTATQFLCPSARPTWAIRPTPDRATPAPAPRRRTPCTGRTTGSRPGSGNSRFDRIDRAADLLDDAAVFVPHR
jgi:hypothetical protein